jgi:ABC-type Na+ efflux pump permease subunit
VSKERISAIMQKEWLDLRRNRAVLAAMILLPIILTGVACGQMITIAHVNLPEKADAMHGFPEHVRAIATNPREATMVMFVMSALMLFSILPVVLPSMMAAHSIAGEKQTHSLEPLLATPVRTWELVCAKIIAIVAPALAPMVVCYGAYLALLAHEAPPAVLSLAASAPFLLSIFLVAPLMSVLSVTFGIMVSSRASDTQAAQGLSGLIVLPVIGLGIAQLFGAVALTVGAMLLRALVLVVLDVGLVLLCVSVFERETILARLK